ncbi:MAG: hypothetical protein ACRD8O_12325 [Bryobacteraceae bacterium]
MPKPEAEKIVKAVLYCPLCTRYVDGDVRTDVRKPHVAPGQKCPRCSSSLDAAIVVQFPKAA